MVNYEYSHPTGTSDSDSSGLTSAAVQLPASPPPPVPEHEHTQGKQGQLVWPVALVLSIDDDGAKELGAALEGNGFLQVLDLSGGSLEIAGIRSIARALEINGYWSIRDLNVSNNPISDEGAEALCMALTTRCKVWKRPDSLLLHLRM